MMSLPYGLLGLLQYQDSTGYDLAKLFEQSLNNFWHAQSSQIYRELNRMEEKGWVASRNVLQDKRPNKRVYAITVEGREHLRSWLQESALTFENPHDSFLMRLFFGAEVPETTLRLLKAYREMWISCLEEGRADLSQSNINHYASQIKGGQKESLYWQLTLDYSIAQIKTRIEWAAACIEKLEQIS